ncbi:MAG: hypothetical protein EXR69_10455 [Myxococcales bacterium]|nr:hypothetical protein [Myxococcales bacterium]
MLCSDVFEPLARAKATSLGLASLRIVTVPHPIAGNPVELLREKAEGVIGTILDCFAGTAVAGAVAGAAAGTGSPARAATSDTRHLVTTAGTTFGLSQSAHHDAESLLDLSMDQGWGDGLPLIPPTDAAVAEMLRHTPHLPGHELGLVAPSFGIATIESVAINAVMAGCRPEYFPLVIAAVEAVVDPTFNLDGIQTATTPVGTTVIVSGPLAVELGVNGRFNAFGPGWRANATIGRALRLVTLNIGGGVPGLIDRATIGQPGKYTSCIAANDADSPWESWTASRGFEAGVTTVTVCATEAPRNLHDAWASTADALLQTFALGLGGAAASAHTLGAEVLLVICPEHARLLAGEGLRRADVAREVFQRARAHADPPWSRLAHTAQGPAQGHGHGHGHGAAVIDAGQLYAAPEDVLVVVGGGPGRQSVWAPLFGHGRSITRPVTPSTAPSAANR